MTIFVLSMLQHSTDPSISSRPLSASGGRGRSGRALRARGEVSDCLTVTDSISVVAVVALLCVSAPSPSKIGSLQIVCVNTQTVIGNKGSLERDRMKSLKFNRSLSLLVC